MPIEFKVKVGKMRTSLFMIIPQAICQAMALEAGDTLAVSLTDHEMLAKKKS